MRKLAGFLSPTPLRPWAGFTFNICGLHPRGMRIPTRTSCRSLDVVNGTSRDGGPEVDWTDTDDYEVTSRLVSIVEARSLTASADMPAGPFFDVIERNVAKR